MSMGGRSVNAPVTAEGGPHHGYLVLADISGYTEFLTGTELEHAHAIVTELMALIRSQLVPPLVFVKLEGDAVLCYADAGTFADGERLLEVLEVCYFEFSNRLFDMERATTCRCAACARMGSLDLKFVAHFGTFMVQHEGGAVDLAGPDVILAHLLLKNNVTEQFGYRAYVLFTDVCLRRIPASIDLPAHAETYPSFGETTGGVHDLKPVLAQMRDTASEYLRATDADLESSVELPFPPALVWQYFVDPEKRLRWQGPYQTGVEKSPNALGRTGLGSTSHCAHADSKEITRHYVDWRPFRYFTVRFAAPEHRPSDLFVIPSLTETTEFIPRDGGGTIVHYRVRVNDRGRQVMDQYRQELLPIQRASWPAAAADLLAVMQEDAVAGLWGMRIPHQPDPTDSR